ncbi:MAG: Hpt domain-containing protein [Phormidesmis sp.]
MLSRWTFWRYCILLNPMVKGHTFAQSDFDWQQLRQLAGEDVDFEAELLAIFLHDAEESLRQLEQAIAHQNIRTIEEIAHSLRGASANVGASALARAAHQLEQIARSGEMTGTQAQLQDLRSHYQIIWASRESGNNPL